MMSVYHVFRYYSPTLGGDVARVMMQREDRRGLLPGVWWQDVRYDGAKGFRAARDAALDALEAAIAAKTEPGEVS